jgi:DNA-directed RNA polymerase subunit RPC12/RpoP
MKQSHSWIVKVVTVIRCPHCKISYGYQLDPEDKVIQCKRCDEKFLLGKQRKNNV